MQQTTAKIMKKVIFALIVIALASCTKEADKCKECSFVLGNGTEYDYKVSFQNWPDGPAPFTLQPGMIKNFQAPADFPVTIVGDFQSPYAHDDFKQTYFCPGDCGVVSVVFY